MGKITAARNDNGDIPPVISSPPYKKADGER